MSILGRRVFTASAWFSGAFVLTKAISFVRLAIMARLLSQDQFGLLAIVVLMVTSLWALSDAGIEAAVVQKQYPSERWLHTAWQMSWMRGVLLGLICWLAAYPVSVFFHQPELSMLLSWAALIPLIHGFTSLGYPLLQKTLDFKKRVWVDLSKEGVFTLVAVTMAIWWYADVTALLFGLLAGTIVSVAVSFAVHGYRPKMVFDFQAARQIWGFGKHLLGAGALIFLMTNLDDAVVGRLLGMEQLGQYTMAFMLAGIITSQLVQLLNSVLFPTMSTMQEDVVRLQRILSFTLRFVVGLLTPITLLALLVPNLLVRVALGEQWSVIVPVFLILMAMGWMRGVATVFGPTILALGHSGAMHRIKWVEFTLFSICIVPAVMTFGIEGAALTLLLVYAMSLVLHVRTVGLLLGSIRPVIKEGLKGALPGIIAFSAVGGWSLVALPAYSGELFLVGMFISIWGVIFFIKEKFFLLMLWAMRNA